MYWGGSYKLSPNVDVASLLQSFPLLAPKPVPLISRGASHLSLNKKRGKCIAQLQTENLCQAAKLWGAHRASRVPYDVFLGAHLRVHLRCFKNTPKKVNRWTSLSKTAVVLSSHDCLQLLVACASDGKAQVLPCLCVTCEMALNESGTEEC